MPKKKERQAAKKLVPKDSKGFYNKAKTAIMTSSAEFIKLRQEIADDSRWKVGQQQLSSEFEKIRTSIDEVRTNVTAGDDKYKDSIQKIRS